MPYTAKFKDLNLKLLCADWRLNDQSNLIERELYTPSEPVNSKTAHDKPERMSDWTVIQNAADPDHGMFKTSTVYSGQSIPYIRPDQSFEKLPYSMTKPDNQAGGQVKPYYSAAVQHYDKTFFGDNKAEEGDEVSEVHEHEGVLSGNTPVRF